MILEIIIARSLNGVHMTPGEMKQYTFTSDAVNKTIAEVNRRINQEFSTYDKSKK
jgi:hypothetical protein